MKKIYILLMHTKTFPSKMIKFFTRFPYTHVGISLEKDCHKIYSFGRRDINSFLKSGFTVENKKGAFFQKFHQTECQIYEITLNEKEFQNIKLKLKKMAQNKMLYKYDFVGLIARFFKIPFKAKNKYVCSYFVAEMLEQENILQFSKKAYFVYPKDFTLQPKLKKIYEGRLSEYNAKEIIIM